MVAAWLGCKRSVVGTEWANSHPGCMNELRKHYTLTLRCSFLAGKATWVLSRCCRPRLLTIACSLTSEHDKVTGLLMCLKVHFGSILESELRQK